MRHGHFGPYGRGIGGGGDQGAPGEDGGGLDALLAESSAAGLMVCSSVDGPALEARVLLGPVFFPILACVYGGGGHKQSLKGALGKEEGRGRKEGKSGHAQPLGPLQAPELPRDPFAAARPGPERGEIWADI